MLSSVRQSVLSIHDNTMGHVTLGNHTVDMISQQVYFYLSTQYNGPANYKLLEKDIVVARGSMVHDM